MQDLDIDKIKKLSFPDFEVEKMDFSSEKKTLKISFEGAWLDEGEGIELGRGFLFFHGWDSLSIKIFNSEKKSWSIVDKSSIEPLRDLCEINFFDSNVSLCGFGKRHGQWMEWKIMNTKMRANFEYQ